MQGLKVQILLTEDLQWSSGINYHKSGCYDFTVKMKTCNRNFTTLSIVIFLGNNENSFFLLEITCTVVEELRLRINRVDSIRTR